MPVEGQSAPATPDELATLYLRARDVPCPGCGYNRRDGVAAACPECDAHLDVNAGTIVGGASVGERRLKALGIALLAVSLAVGPLYAYSVYDAVVYYRTTAPIAGPGLIPASIIVYVAGAVLFALATYNAARLVAACFRQKPAQPEYTGRLLTLTAWLMLLGVIPEVIFEIVAFVL